MALVALAMPIYLLYDKVLHPYQNLPPVLTCVVWHCRFHMDQLMNMGNYHVRDIDGIVKRSELYNETLMQMEVNLPDGITNFV